MSDSSGLMGYVIGSFYLIGGGVAVVATLLYYNQSSLLYMPYPNGLPRTPKENPRGARSPQEYAVICICIDGFGRDDCSSRREDSLCCGNDAVCRISTKSILRNITSKQPMARSFMLGCSCSATARITSPHCSTSMEMRATWVSDWRMRLKCSEPQ